jgi:hypothetical protein
LHGESKKNRKGEKLQQSSRRERKSVWNKKPAVTSPREWEREGAKCRPGQKHKFPPLTEYHLPAIWRGERFFR